jgi:hypothetical protein
MSLGIIIKYKVMSDYIIIYISYYILALQSHHQGGIHKGIEVNQILWKMCETCASLTELAGFFILQDGGNKVVRIFANFQPLCHNQEDRIHDPRCCDKPRSQYKHMTLYERQLSQPTLYRTIECPHSFFLSLCKLELKEHITCFNPDE